ncbi:hypothetical protein H0H87_001369 [Tephrocybe sp. NHM501043]|nr:hypothetical protein H0H87_001369 [Tephrocybe sp. NHM501043]
MSLFFDVLAPSKVHVSFKPGSESNLVVIGKNHWPATHHAPIPVCIEPSRKSRVNKPSSIHKLVCWAHLDETVRSMTIRRSYLNNELQQVDDVNIPLKWKAIYPHVFPSVKENIVSIVPTELVLLTEVVIMALSPASYQVATMQESVLEDWLCNEHTVLRHGDIHSFNHAQLPLNGHGSPPSSVTYSYRLDMVEPVLQGFANKAVTRFIVILADGDKLPSQPEAEEDLTDSEFEAIEIGEEFLANSTLSPSFASHDPAYETANGAPEITFCTKPLLQSIDDLTDHCTLYIRTSDLSKIGIQNGDWAMARPSSTVNCRLVRILADDDMVFSSGTIMGSPILLRNLSPESSSMSNTLYICPSSFGSRQPPVPNARALTIARVASPISISRIYQPLCLKSLKAYFDSKKRLIKHGDIIAVSIDTSDTIHPYEDTKNEEIEDGLKLPAFPSRSNEIVFFSVTNVEHDVVKHDSSVDVYNGSTMGELGCWVDTSVTRMVQAGVEHSWVPNVGSYFGTDPSSPRALYSTLNSQGSSHLLAPGSPYDKLLQFMSATSAQEAMEYKLNLSVLLKGARGTGKFTVASWVAQDLGMHILQINCYDLIGESDTKTEGTLRARFDKAKECSPCVLLLHHIEAFSQSTQAPEPGKEPAIANALKECIADAQDDWKMTGYPVVILGTTSQPSRVPSSILTSFKHEVLFEAPGEGERYETLKCSLIDDNLAADVSLVDLATQTAALVASDLGDLVDRARFAAVDRAIRSGARPFQVPQAGLALTATDFEVALAKSRSSYSESIGAPKIPNVTWDDVGGLAHVKSDILDTIQLPLEHPELFSDGLKKRSGILLYGPPGTGKTLLAKAVATSCSLNFFSVKGPELLNMYIGESEANVRRVFQRARDAKPCVVFFDELDSVAPKRGNQGDSGGVMDRIVSQLLAELDGMSAGKGAGDVFVIGATNRPDLLDPALLRPGRFDRMLYLGVSDTHLAQQNILEALTRKFRLAPNLNLRDVAEQCPFNYTGADFYALCSDAMLNAMSRKAKDVDDKIAQLNIAPRPHDYPTPLTPQYFLAEMASESDLAVLVSREDFDRALKDLVPSVSQSEMDHYAQIQRKFSESNIQD